jgi:dihydrofolate reductase
MRTVIFGGANSLDNYIAGPGGRVDWLLFGDEAAAIMAETWKTIDTIVMGRKTYEAAQKMTQEGQGQAEDAFPGVTTYVVSRTLTELAAGATLIREDAAAFVRRLKTQPGRDICIMGGGELGRSLLEAGVVDRLGVNIHPILLGAGTPLFHAMSRQIDLELEECRPFKNGCIYASYRVRHA